MAKRKKLQDNNPPRRVEIRGQDHLLAYITPEEAQMLMDNGGSGKPGPMGIPAFYTEDDFDADLADSTGAQVGSSDDGYDTRARATEKDYGVPDPTSSEIEAARGFDFDSPASKAMEASFALGFNQMGPGRGMGYNVSGREANVALGQIADRMAMAKAGYNLTGLLAPLGKLAGLRAQANLSKIAENIKSGYPAAFDKNEQVQGAWGPGLVSGTMAYSGNPVEGNPGTGWADDNEGGDGPEPEVKPVNPETGQCDAGYMFDTDLQACRLDTGGVASTAAAGQTFEPGAYARMGLLDQTPQGLLQVAGQPYDFDAANRAFRMATATRPEYYSDPYDLTGYTLLA